MQYKCLLVPCSASPEEFCSACPFSNILPVVNRAILQQRLAKLVSLLIKTLAKPVSKQIKRQFVKQPVSRNALIWVGQAQHAASTRMTIWSSGYKVRSINKLEEGEALSQGADLLSETFLFAVSGGIVIYEYNRSSAKEKKKEEARLQLIRDDATKLQAKLDSLDKRLVALEEFAQANRRSILGIGANSYTKPDQVVPINDEEAVGNNGAFVEQKKIESTEIKNDPRAENSAEKSQRSWRWWPF